jgi:LmbE family N-acetylglucosaminyl deacetylase
MSISRRTLLASATAAVPLAAAFPQSATGHPPGRLKVVVAGGHPGDPECGCGGVIARYTQAGHEVALLYLNRGEGFCTGADPGQCGVVRTAEAQNACRILKARAAFAGQYDGRSIVDPPHYDEFRRVLESEKPDVVFAQWPIDKHRDHRALSTLVLDAWLAGGKQSALYFYEVADDTMMFSPTEFVDISGVESQRRAACYAHASQQPEKWYPAQAELTRFRGIAAGFPQAEAFVRHWESRRTAVLP